MRSCMARWVSATCATDLSGRGGAEGEGAVEFRGVENEVENEA